ncbi:MAG: tetratricopeptide repeat protein [Acidiferrobacterales bacterium]
MARILVLLISLAVTPLFAAELEDSYVKLFKVQVQLAKGGSAGALYSLGQMHEHGMGTKVDIDKAYTWYEKAASKGDVRAKYKLANRSSTTSRKKRVKKATAAARSAKTSANKQKVNRELTAKKRARAKALLKKQHELAQATDMEEL